MLPAIAGFKFKEDENFNHPDKIGTGIHTLSILRIALKLHFVQNVESDTEIGQKGAFCKGLILFSYSVSSKIPVRYVITNYCSRIIVFQLLFAFILAQ